MLAQVFLVAGEFEWCSAVDFSNAARRSGDIDVDRGGGSHGRGRERVGCGGGVDVKIHDGFASRDGIKFNALRCVVDGFVLFLFPDHMRGNGSGAG